MAKSDKAESEVDEMGMNGSAVAELDPNEAEESQGIFQSEEDVLESQETDESEEESEEEDEFISEIELDGESLPMDEQEEESDDDEDDEIAQSDDPLITKIRKVNRQKNDELKAKNKEIEALKRQLEEQQLTGSVEQQEGIPQQNTLEPEPPPKYEDFDTDEDFNEANAKYYAEEAEKAKLRAEQEAKEQAAKDAWSEKIKAYQEGQKRFKADFKKIEEEAFGHIEDTEKLKRNAGIVVNRAKDPSLVMAALAKDPKSKELTDLDDPFDVAVALHEYEKRIGANKKKVPKPEKTVRGGHSTAEISGNLAKLEKEAAKTGDRTKLVRYMRSKNLL